MTLWLIIPRDPLIFRDGKPFTNSPGSRAKTLPFLFPSTSAGAVRTKTGIDPTTGIFDKQRIPAVLQKQVRGPFLVELDDDGGLADWLMPAPADAVLFQTNDDQTAMRYALAPINLPNGASSDLNDLKVVAFSKIIKEKPLSPPYHFWHLKEFLNWLSSPADGQVNLPDLGIQGLPIDSRTHVSIDPGTLASLSGALYQTAGLEFTSLKQSKTGTLRNICKLAIAVDTDAELREDLGFLGGERRVAHWRQPEEKNSKLPACPLAVKQKIVEQKACRLILVTPAYFKDGFKPEWVNQQFSGVKVDLISVAINRYQTISGWDYAYQNGNRAGRPKPTRRLAPAGSVYYLQLSGEPKVIENFVDKIWMNAVSDDPQSCLDGFGIAVVGAWDGQIRKMEVQS